MQTLALIATTMCLLVLPKEQGQCVLLGPSLGSQQDTLTLFSQDGVAKAPASVGEGEGSPVASTRPGTLQVLSAGGQS